MAEEKSHDQISQYRKEFDKIQHASMMKEIFRKTGIKDNFFSLIKASTKIL